jgi:hypothetical protein
VKTLLPVPVIVMLFVLGGCKKNAPSSDEPSSTEPTKTEPTPKGSGGFQPLSQEVIDGWAKIGGRYGYYPKKGGEFVILDKNGPIEGMPGFYFASKSFDEVVGERLGGPIPQCGAPFGLDITHLSPFFHEAKPSPIGKKVHEFLTAVAADPNLQSVNLGKCGNDQLNYFTSSKLRALQAFSFDAVMPILIKGQESPKVPNLIGCLTDEGLRTISKFQSLERLFIRGYFTDEGLKSLCKMPHLQQLILDGDFSPNGPSVLAQLPNLKYLAISGDYSPKTFAAFTKTKLERLTLLGKITPDLFPVIGQLPELRSLILMARDSKEHWGIFHFVHGELPLDEHQFFVFNKPLIVLPQDTLEPLRNLKNMERLSLSGIELSEKHLEVIREMKTLKQLTISGNFKSEALSVLGELPNIERATVSFATDSKTNYDFLRLLKKHKNIKRLMLSPTIPSLYFNALAENGLLRLLDCVGREGGLPLSSDEEIEWVTLTDHLGIAIMRNNSRISRESPLSR